MHRTHVSGHAQPLLTKRHVHRPIRHTGHARQIEHLRTNISQSKSHFPSDLRKSSSCLDESLSTLPTGVLLRESTDYLYINRIRNPHNFLEVIHKYLKPILMKLCEMIQTTGTNTSTRHYPATVWHHTFSTTETPFFLVYGRESQSTPPPIARTHGWSWIWTSRP